MKSVATSKPKHSAFTFYLNYKECEASRAVSKAVKSPVVLS